MDIEDMRLILEIEKCGNISAAAHNLFLTQSTASRRLNALEKELNLHLFIRGKGLETVVPTPVCKRMSVIAKQFISLDADVRSLREYDMIQRISIGSTDSIASYPLRDFFHILPTSKPNWDIEMLIYDSVPIFDMISNRILDVGITNGSAYMPDLESHLLFSEEFVVIRRGERKNDSPFIHPRELNSNHEIFQLFSSEYQHWHHIWWPQDIAKFRVNLAHFTVGFLTNPEDWAILPYSVAKALLPEDGYILHLLENPPPRRCFFVRRRELRPDKKEVILELERALKSYVSSLSSERTPAPPPPPSDSSAALP